MKTKISLIIMLTIFCLSINLKAQVPTLLKVGVGNGVASSSISLVLGNYFYFKVTNGTVKQLWKTDGTPVGTEMVKDSIADFLSLVNINNTLYFIGYTSSTTRGLWKSDGTTAGTVLVKDFTGTYSQAVGLTTINNVCYFNYTPNSLTTPFSIWKTDGTDLGTVEVKANLTLSAGAPRELFYQAGSETIFFAVSTSVGYNSLWKTDGTSSGTTMIKDSIMQTAAGNTLGEYINVNGIVFFTVSTGGTYNLWRTDGTNAGTFIVGGGLVIGLTNLNGVVYFRNGSGISSLWKSDGTIAGTSAVSGIDKIGNGIASIGNNLYLGGKDSYDLEPYISDGTASGTVLLKDVKPGSGMLGSTPMYFTKVNTTLVFVANDGINGNQIWKTDGTPIITVMAYAVADTLSSNEAPTTRIALNNYFLFVHGGPTGDLYSLLVSNGLGINNEYNSMNSFKIFPNPSTGIFNLEWHGNKNAFLKVYNILGEEVMQKPISNEINLFNMPKGIYFVKLINGEKIYTRKIVVQ